MQTTGIIRKIDELGRIVLPKELRKYLNINSGDDFQITIENEKIILEKYSRLQNEELELIRLINCFSSITNYNIYLVINNKIVNSEYEEITKEVQNIIQERKIYIDETNNINITNTITNKDKIIINPIILDSDLLGTIIITGKESIKNMMDISKIIERIIKLKYM